MTKERAIELLHRISDSQFDGIHGDERREALEMAVRALEGDGDTISRKMAIDALTRKSTQLHGLHWGDHPEAPHIESGVLSSIEIIRELPSAQPERKTGRWIGYAGTIGNECSICNKWLDVLQGTAEMNYCPNCGAKMGREIKI